MPPADGAREPRRGPWHRLVVGPWRRYVLGSFEAAERESRQAIQTRPGAIDPRVMTVCVVVAVNLTLLQYFGLSNRIGWVPRALRKLNLQEWAFAFERHVMLHEHSRLFGLLYWVAFCGLVYMVIPALIVRFGFRQRLSDYGLSLTGAFKHFKVYVLLYLIVLPPILLVADDQAFLLQYPFYHADNPNELPAHFVGWELAYAFQFFALEFFFRGFMVHGLKHRFGAYAVFVMMMPYCMIHFGKPFPETMGAVVAGLVLGFLSLRTGTIWLGFLIHVSVAVTMDVAALMHKGLL